MPPLARRFLKTSFFFGGLGILTGMHMASALLLQAGGMHYGYKWAHTHSVLVGFFLMMWMSVLLWKLPEAPAGSRYKPALMVWIYWAMTLSTLVRFLSESAIGYFEQGPHWMRYMIFWTATLQGLAALAFLINLLPRVNAPEA